MHIGKAPFRAEENRAPWMGKMGEEVAEGGEEVKGRREVPRRNDSTGAPASDEEKPPTAVMAGRKGDIFRA